MLFSLHYKVGNFDLVKLILCGNDIDDEGIQLLVPLVSRMSSLKCLGLGSNSLATPTGWQALTVYFQSPNFGLRELFLDENNVDDEMLISYSSALKIEKKGEVISHLSKK